MPKGKVKEYNSGRGYGTIIDSDTNRQLSVYANKKKKKKGEVLNENQEVNFEIEHHRNDDWAVDVRIS